MKTKMTSVEFKWRNYMKTSILMRTIFALFMVTLVSACEKDDVLPELENSDGSIPESSVLITRSQLMEFLPCFCLYSMDDFDDDVTVPQVVKNQFRSDFPNAHDIDWEGSEQRELYEVEFEIKDKEYEAIYDKEGGLIMTMTEISLSRVPTIVREGFRNHYGNDWEVDDDDAHKIVTSIGVFYKFEIENECFDDFDDRNTFFDSNGNFIEDCFGDDFDDDDKKELPSGSVYWENDKLNEFFAFLCRYDDDFDDFDDDVRTPQNVREQFKKDFPNATDIEWEGHENRQCYLVEFELMGYGDDDDIYALYDKDGNLLMSMEEISLPLVPKEVKVGIRTHYGKGWGIEDDDVDRITLATGTYYKFELENDYDDDDERNAIFDQSGRFIVDYIDD